MLRCDYSHFLLSVTKNVDVHIDVNRVLFLQLNFFVNRTILLVSPIKYPYVSSVLTKTKGISVIKIGSIYLYDVRLQ